MSAGAWRVERLVGGTWRLDFCGPEALARDYYTRHAATCREPMQLRRPDGIATASTWFVTRRAA